MIKDLWAKGVECIFYMRVVNIDTASFVYETPEKSILTAEQNI